MISSAVFSTALMLLGPSAGQATEEVEPLSVHLFARTIGAPMTKSWKAREKELKSKKKEAEQARKELDKKLKAQFGKDRDDWPKEQQEEYRVARDAETFARLRYDANGKSKDLDDSVEDIMRAIQGKGLERKKKWISLVENRDQAHLLVEIVYRRKFREFRVLAVRISPVEAFRSNRFDDIGPKESSVVKVRHTYRHGEPYWILECGAGGSMWRNAASVVAGRLNMFIEDNRAVLMGDGPTP